MTDQMREFDLRGELASKLLCWHRLTVPEVDNLLEFFEAATLAEPVAWMCDGGLVMRKDWAERIQHARHRDGTVDLNRAIPNAWEPVLFTAPQAPTAEPGQPPSAPVGDAERMDWLIKNALIGFELDDENEPIASVTFVTPAESLHDLRKAIDAAIAQLVQPADVARAGVTKSDLVHLYWSGYTSGHHDTVEGGYIDVAHHDSRSYHADVVDSLISEGNIAQPVQPAEILCDAERQSWELHLEQAAAIRELLDLHAPKTEGNLQTRLAQVFAQPVQSGNMALSDVFRDGCKECVREKQSRSDNKEWQEGVKRGKEIVSLMAIRAINDKKVKLCPQD